MQDSIGFSELKKAEEGFSADEEDMIKTNKFKTKVEELQLRIKINATALGYSNYIYYSIPSAIVLSLH